MSRLFCHTRATLLETHTKNRTNRVLNSIKIDWKKCPDMFTDHDFIIEFFIILIKQNSSQSTLRKEEEEEEEEEVPYWQNYQTLKYLF